jgi:hypothetical protein
MVREHCMTFSGALHDFMPVLAKNFPIFALPVEVFVSISLLFR